ncbi:MAG: aminopeptidase [Methanofollis sp.]|nr:aminopeptidase [Methanofollis sp.]
MTRLFKYYPEDFGELPVDVIHMDLTFSVGDDLTDVTACMQVQVKNAPVSRLDLNARNLDVLSASCEEYPAAIEYDRENHRLSFIFDAPVLPGARLHLDTRTRCRPSRHILEGLYYDETPAWAPPTQITQCQQWGFQRIVPCFDDMTAKCTYTTTIIADERYTNLISNGDVRSGRKPCGNGRVAVTYDNVTTPMAPYLFFLGVGTYATFSRTFEYPDGHTFTLELLVPPGSDDSIARQALEVLANGVLWVYLFTGPDCNQNVPLRRRLWDLCHERDQANAAGNAERVAALRSALEEGLQSITPGYAYTGTVYREIGMQNSDYGGMENVGNTTITTNRIMPVPAMTDHAYEYMVRVKVHEYYHNLNGSEVTGKSPFELWLNEAVTVHMENAHFAFLFGEGYARLQTVIDLISPEGGTFALDAGAASMPIEPAGFNDPNELITGVTYVKAPEFVRMIETIMGKETFARALDLYHRRFAHGNASRQDWLDAMEEMAGRNFSGMAAVWLKQAGFPILRMAHQYDPLARSCTITLDQETSPGAEPWTFPFVVGLVDGNGHDLAETTHPVTGRHEEIVFENIEAPAFVSANRGYSFYGRVADDATSKERDLQARHDPDLVGRFCAFQSLAETEMLGLIENPRSVPSPSFCELYYELVSDESLISAAGGQFMTIFESVTDPRFAHRYTLLYRARQRLLRGIAGRYQDELVELHRHYADAAEGWDPAAIKGRQVKNMILHTLAPLDTPPVHTLIREQFETAVNATDRLSAFSAYMDSSASDRNAVFETFRARSEKDLVSWETFLAAVAGIRAPDTLSLIQKTAASPSFRIEQSNDQRALFGRFAHNRVLSLETAEGRAYLGDVLSGLAVINEYNTVGALEIFGALDQMGEEYQAPLVDVLLRIMRAADPREQPSVYNTARRLLHGAPHAVAAYIRSVGPARELGDLPHPVQTGHAGHEHM